MLSIPFIFAYSHNMLYAYLLINEDNPGLRILEISEPEDPESFSFMSIDVGVRTGLC